MDTQKLQLLQADAVEHGIKAWCGGMLEAGIGRAHNIALSTLPGFTLPGDVSASERYWEEDIINPPVTVSPAGNYQDFRNSWHWLPGKRSTHRGADRYDVRQFD